MLRRRTVVRDDLELQRARREAQTFKDAHDALCHAMVRHCTPEQIDTIASEVYGKRGVYDGDLDSYTQAQAREEVGRPLGGVR